jgi:hypothetical protein
MIKGRRPFNHGRRERSTNLGVTNLTPSAFRPFCRLGKGSRRHTSVCLKKRSLPGGETKRKHDTEPKDTHHLYPPVEA